jgi:hypothetical protein
MCCSRDAACARGGCAGRTARNPHLAQHAQHAQQRGPKSTERRNWRREVAHQDRQRQFQPMPVGPPPALLRMVRRRHDAPASGVDWHKVCPTAADLPATARPRRTRATRPGRDGRRALRAARGHPGMHALARPIRRSSAPATGRHSWRSRAGVLPPAAVRAALSSTRTGRVPRHPVHWHDQVRRRTPGPAQPLDGHVEHLGELVEVGRHGVADDVSSAALAVASCVSSAGATCCAAMRSKAGRPCSCNHKLPGA